MKRSLIISLILFSSSLVGNAQIFNGTGGPIITLTDTSRFNLNVSGLSPSTMNFTFGLESVRISITHTRDADIDCFLAAPDGTRIELTTDNGGTSDHYTNTVFKHDASTPITSGNAPFTGTYSPEGELWRVNNGQNGNGIWQLRVIDDNNNGVTGSVVSWTLTFSNTPAKTFIFDQSNLPIVVINTNGQTIPDDPKIICDMGIIYNGPGMRNYLSNPHNDYSGKIAIEIRGSSSQMFDKKSYGFETRGPNTQIDTNVSLLGMPLEHDWILSANYSDKTFCRNVLAYQLANEMGHYAVRTHYVDLVINGTYKGIYVLMETIKRDGDRVDVKKLYTTETTYPDISGGYMIKIDKTTGSGGDGWNSPYQPINHPNNQRIYFQYEYPKPDSIVLSQEAYIRAYIDSFESRLNGPNFMDSTLGYAKYIGNKSFIDYFFSNEISRNVDGYRISSYLYKDKEKTLKAGPIWDYDIAWGNANYCSGNLTTGWAYQHACTNDSYQPPFWWQRMLQDTNYANQVKCRWIELRANVLSTSHIHSIIDSIAQVLDESKDWNFTAWPILGTYVWPNPSPYPSTYAGEITNLKNWISTRLSWMDSNMPGRCNCSFTIAKQDITCLNACNGQAVALGVSPYQKMYLWDSGDTNDTIRNLCPGPYDVTFEDAIGCKRQATVTITQPAALLASATSTNATCAGSSCNGSATISPSGGTSPYTYSWSSGHTSSSVSTLCSGSYTVVVSDARGCTKSVSFTITNPGAPAISVTSLNEVSCPGGSNGSAIVSVTGGAAPYTYAWSPSGGTNQNASGLAAGNYTLVATDQNGCQSSKTVTIDQPPSFTSTVSSTAPLCFGGSNGSASIAVNGGSSPYSYSWSPSGGSQAAASQLAAGNYSVTVTDASGCTFSRSINVTQPTVITTSTSSMASNCFGGSDGSAQVIVGGGVGPYTYQWSASGSTTNIASGLSAGTYNVIVSDANACTKSASVSVGQPAQIVLTTSSSPAMCGGADGSASVSASGGVGPYQYNWTPLGGTASSAQNLSAGVYTVRVTDSHSCSVTAQAAVINSNGMTSVVNNKTNVSCFGASNGSATVTASNGALPYSYQWSPSGGTSATATGLSSGIYTVTIQDALGCVNIQQVNITEPGSLILSTTNNSVLCFGGNSGSATAIVAGGTQPYSYQWSPSGGIDSTATSLIAGNYSVRVTDAQGCTNVQSVVIDQSPPIQISFSHTDATCGLNNGSASVQLSGGNSPYSIVWNETGDTINSVAFIAAGIYSVSVVDSFACTKTDNVTIGDSPIPAVSIVSQNDVTCNGGNDGRVSLTTTSGTGPYTYTWSPNVAFGSTANGIVSDIYSVLVVDAAGCRDSITFQIDEPAPLAMLMFATNVSCAGAANGRIFADAGGGTLPYTFLWSPGGQTGDTAQNLSQGTYDVILTDSNGCTATAFASITEPPQMIATLLTTDEVCGGACDGTASVQLTGGTLPYRYLWCDGDTSALAIHLCEGACSVNIADGNNCELIQTFQINGPDPLDVTAMHTDVTCAGCSDGTALVTLTGGVPPYSYLWTPGGQTSSSVAGLVAGIYTVCVTDSDQCIKCETIEILDGTIGVEEMVRTSFLYLYPNPLSSHATFLFRINNMQHIRLELFDLNGRLVNSVIDKKLTGGEHLVPFNGSPLANGLYFYRFISNDLIQTGRLIIEH
ncbi:MAG: CotH kinase family protein [Bacteroidia bacterium]|nr:CotH kinase family protein [Bacteroidia bacterium]